MQTYIKMLLRFLILGCLIFAVLTGIRVALGQQLSFNTWLYYNFLFTMAYTVCISIGNAAVFIWLERYYKNKPFTTNRLLAGFLGSFAITVLILFLLRIFEEVIINGNSFTTFIANETVSNYVVSIILFFFISLAVHFFFFYKSYQENKVKQQKIIAGTASAKFESLKNQIDPHFLFNSLNVLSSLIEENPDNAQKFTASLSRVYRYVLEQKDKDLVPLSEELSFAKIYMDLLQMRFENSLYYQLPETADPEFKIPPLSLQLLLENAVKHNRINEQNPLQITILIEGKELVITNNIRKKQAMLDRKGVGLQNIVDRYSIITDRKMAITETSDTFTVRLPLLTRQCEDVNESEVSIDKAYLKAQKKVDDIKGFYGNFYTYLTVIAGLAIFNLATSPSILWFLYPAIGWGVGVLVHAASVYNWLPFLGKDWEERKINKILERKSKQAWK